MEHARDCVAELKYVAHEVRNALNGASVNLEVARTRSRRGIDVAQLTPFLDTAAQQLESVAELYAKYTLLVAEVTENMTAGSTANSGLSQPAKP